MLKPNPQRILRLSTLSLIAITIPLGFGLKYYHGPGHTWCNLYGAGVLYEVFWCLTAFLFFPSRKAIIPVTLSVFFVTCGLEVLQLWHPPFLETIRATRPGVWLLGNGFDWWDFPHYAAGCALGWLVMKNLAKSLRVTP